MTSSAIPRDSKLAVAALVFDAYGTLFDVHSVATLAETLAPGRGAKLSELWRAKQLEYTWLSSLMAGAAPLCADFGDVTAQALDHALAALGVDLRADDRLRLRQAYLGLSLFSDVVGALERLAPRPRWILSNGTTAMLEPLVRSSGLERHLDGVLSVEAARIFKPHPRAYQLAAERLSLPRERIGFVSSNCWDAIGAKMYGFTSFWINRRRAPVDTHGPAPDHVIATLGDLPTLLDSRSANPTSGRGSG